MTMRTATRTFLCFLLTLARVDAVMKQVVPAGVSYKVGGTAQSLLDSSNAINISTYEIVLILSVNDKSGRVL